MYVSTPRITPKLQKNKSTVSLSKSHRSNSHSKSNSLFLTNKLTKSYFSLHDTSLANRTSIQKSKLIPQYKPVSKIRGATSILLQRYNSEHKEVPQSYHNITETHIPKIYLRRPPKQSTPTSFDRVRTQNNTRNNKFKLLFKQPMRKTVSQRKIDKIDRKIFDLRNHNRFLQTLRPPQKIFTIQQKRIPKGVIVNEQRITKLAIVLIRNLSTYFAMYHHGKKVGDILKSFDGYNQVVHKILFQNKINAKKIQNEKEIQQFFWIFQDEDKRPQFFGQEDFFLFSSLQNYSLKMQKSSHDIKKNFAVSQERKMTQIKRSIAKKLTINEKKLQSNAQMDSIVNFIDNRRRHNQDRRQSSFAKLQQLGVKFNIDQRNKQIILTERQKVMKSCAVNDFK